MRQGGLWSFCICIRIRSVGQNGDRSKVSVTVRQARDSQGRLCEVGEEVKAAAHLQVSFSTLDRSSGSL